MKAYGGAAGTNHYSTACNIPVRLPPMHYIYIYTLDHKYTHEVINKQEVQFAALCTCTHILHIGSGGYDVTGAIPVRFSSRAPYRHHYEDDNDNDVDLVGDAP
jgi:hypothetical protein